MNAQLSHHQAEGLFLDFADHALVPAEEKRLTQHLADCSDCLVQWQRYEQTVSLLNRQSREKAPPDLASVIARRVRRKRMFGARGLMLMHAQYRVPVETIIPPLIGVLVAAFLVLSAP